jgi:hypothetical protein
MPNLEERVAALEVQTADLDLRVTALEGGTPEPATEVWKDFVADFVAPTDGSDCSSQWAAAAAWMQSVRDARPCLRLGPHTFNGVGFLCDGVKDGIIDGNGATLPGMWIGAQGTLAMDHAHSAAIDSVDAGAVAVILKDVADAAKLTVGGYVLVSGIGLQGGADLGYPPNFHNFEYRKITAIKDRTLALDEPLTFEYRDTWPPMQLPPSASDPTTNCGGPATLYAMSADWGTTIEIRNLTCTDPYSVYGGGAETVTLANVCFTGRGPSCSLARHWINKNCDMGGRTEASEMDKLTSDLVYDNCTGGGLWFQSTSITKASFINSEFGFIQGSPRYLVIDKSTIGCLKAGQSYGIADTLTATGSVLTEVGVSYHFITLDNFTYEQRPEGGVFKLSVKDNCAQCFPHPPGYLWAWGIYDGSWHIHPDATDPFDGTATAPVTFTISDIRLEGDPETGDVVLQTDIMEYPPKVKFWNGPATQAFALPYKAIAGDPFGGSLANSKRRSSRKPVEPREKG